MMAKNQSQKCSYLASKLLKEITNLPSESVLN